MSRVASCIPSLFPTAIKSRSWAFVESCRCGFFGTPVRSSFFFSVSFMRTLIFGLKEIESIPWGCPLSIVESLLSGTMAFWEQVKLDLLGFYSNPAFCHRLAASRSLFPNWFRITRFTTSSSSSRISFPLSLWMPETEASIPWLSIQFWSHQYAVTGMCEFCPLWKLHILHRYWMRPDSLSGFDLRIPRLMSPYGAMRRAISFSLGRVWWIIGLAGLAWFVNAGACTWECVFLFLHAR